jgi:Delta7-sterol 5-desaturase
VEFGICGPSSPSTLNLSLLSSTMTRHTFPSSVILFITLFSLLIDAVHGSSNSTATASSSPLETLLKLDFGVENPYREFNLLINSLILPKSLIEQVMNSGLDPDTSYYAVSYLRDLIAGTCVYWITAGLWHITIYYLLGERLFKSKGRPYPETSVIFDQILLAQSSIFIYAGLPVISEFLIENNYTRVYFYLSDVGGLQFYLLYLALYVVFFEIGIYWMHRTLHTNKFLYKYVHGLHHKYNKHETLTPWASIAFNPLDGMLQASPYVAGLFFIPVHYLTHVFLLFFSGVWATCIHDSVVRLSLSLSPPSP